MAKTVKTNQLPIVTDLTGAKIVGLTAEGIDAQFPLANIVRSEKPIAYPVTVPTGDRFPGETWPISTTNYGVAFPNFGNITPPIKVGDKYAGNSRFVWSYGNWNIEYELFDAPDFTGNYVSKTDVFNAPIVELVTTRNVGQLWTATSPSSLITSTTQGSTNKISGVPGDIFAISGLSNIASANTGRFLNSAGGYLSSLTSASFTPITGGYSIVIPSGSSMFVLNVVNADLAGLSVIKGSVYVSPGSIDPTKVKLEALPTGIMKTKVSELSNDSGFIPGSDLYDSYPAQLVTNKYSGQFWTGSGVSVLAPISGNSAVNKIAVVAGDFLAVEGLTDITATQIGRYLDGTGSVLGNILPTHFNSISKGYRLAIPVSTYPTVAFAALNVKSADLPNIGVQYGSFVIKKKVKSDLITQDITGKSNSEANFSYLQGRKTKVDTSAKKPGIIIASQSQFDGRLPVSTIPLPAEFVSAGNTIPGCIINNSLTLTNFSNIHTYNSTDLQVSPSRWSPEILLYQKIITHNRGVSGHSTDNIYVTKTSLGGTSFSILKGEGAGKWNIDFDAITAFSSGQTKLASVLESRINAMTTAEGINFENRLLIIVIGESDRNDADSFYQNCKNFIYYMRGVVNNPLLPVIIVGVNSTSAQYSSVIEGAKAQLSTDVKNVAYVPATGTTTLDTIHWDLSTATTVVNDIYAEIESKPLIYRILN
ncbi:sialate O-acetylesterase [Pedobacter metabolipauper]|uniref:Sialate O-acetylesterase domain-containing protein n=1 Tax=Pedobacter metabolipauper TaxID=425513 RepID=A0A4R6T339_9SPHI|nr:sialate O-acetylesterase [Pedobacter metabolipauper]TDQ12158.1 hypothetical protein ATK78_1290 [Pedobacter metabolipauper]